MDSVTQAALGAVVGQTLMGKHIGRLAPLWGIALGTLPDLDVLINFGGAVEDFTYHRGFSHSLFVQLLLSPLVVWLILKIHSGQMHLKKQWFIAVLAIFWSHSLLDAMTVYGTQLFWPFTDYPVGLSSIFIIDPLYTLPLLIGLGLAARAGWRAKKAHTLSIVVLLLSTSYLAWTVVAKSLIDHKLDAALALAEQSESLGPVKATLSTPMPINTLLWRTIVLHEDHYQIAHYSLWDDPAKIDFKTYERRIAALDGLHQEWDVERLKWFSKDFYKVSERDGHILISDLRMGVEGTYAFNFAIAKLDEQGRSHAIKAKQMEDQIDFSKFGILWDRLWDSSVSLHPTIKPINELQRELNY